MINRTRRASTDLKKNANQKHLITQVSQSRKISPIFVFIALSAAATALAVPALLLEDNLDRDELGKGWIVLSRACELVETQTTFMLNKPTIALRLSGDTMQVDAFQITTIEKQGSLRIDNGRNPALP